MKEANRWMRVILIIFQKKKLFEANGPFWAPKWYILWISPKNFLKFYRMEGANRYMKILLVVF